jgi:DNA/RNA endonuclease YhcR with UshA esterase domain
MLMLSVVFVVVVALLGAAHPVLAQDAPSTHPVVIDVTDKAAVEAAMNRDAIVEGVVERAEWSRSGKVMNIEFKDAGNGLLAVVFDRKRQQLDQAFAGDLGKALTGAKVRIKGTIKPYGGRVESMKGRPQIIIDDGHQITIMESRPATQPTSSLSPSEGRGPGEG